MKRIFFLKFLLLAFISLNAQWLPDSIVKYTMQERMYKVIDVLTSEEFEGREANTIGEIKSKLFIEEQFKQIGLKPFYADNSYFKSFTYLVNKIDTNETYIEVNNNKFLVNKDFFVNSFAPNQEIVAELVNIKYGLQLPNHNIDNYKKIDSKSLVSKIFLIDINFPKEYNFIDSSNFYSYVQLSINTAISNGALGIILYQSRDPRFKFNKESFFQSARTSRPILFAAQNFSDKLLKLKNNKVKISIENLRVSETAFNVAAKIDNKAEKTIVIGAHYDHLGYGTRISLHYGNPKIHPGADDNASGIAALLELARIIKNQELNNHNYVFVAFGAEEKGLIGSQRFLEDSIELIPSYLNMFNLDMIGRLDSLNPQLTILGTGTSNLWDSLINVTHKSDFNISKVSSGIGGSDHTSFYLKNIPVLFFFTGLHSEYHRPSDVIELINFTGLVQITTFVFNLLTHIENLNYLGFQETKNTRPSSERRARSVSLGIMPDHAYEGVGIRVADVFENRPASKAGILKGDVITKIEETMITDISTYMKVLSELKPGQTINVKINRANNEIFLNINL